MQLERFLHTATQILGEGFPLRCHNPGNYSFCQSPVFTVSQTIRLQHTAIPPTCRFVWSVASSVNSCATHLRHKNLEASISIMSHTVLQNVAINVG